MAAFAANQFPRILTFEPLLVIAIAFVQISPVDLNAETRKDG